MIKELDHHAYGIVGDIASSKASLKKALKKLKIELQSNPDFFDLYFANLKIEDSRIIKNLAMDKPFGEKRILLISFERATVDAQNSLLKLLEEPGEGNHFFLLIREIDSLIPTLRSRLFFIESEHAEIASENFLELSYKERLELIKELEDREERELLAFLEGLELSLAKNPEKLEKFYAVRKYAKDSAANKKNILEHLALTL